MRTVHGGVSLLWVMIGGSVLADPMGPHRPRWTTVAMMSQTVEITVTPHKVAVEGTYNFHNTGKSLTMPVGYPRGPLEAELHDFQAALCGEALALNGKKPGNRASPSSYMFDPTYPDWKVFEVSFAEDQRRTLSISYWVEPVKLKAASGDDLLYYSYILRTGAYWKGPIERATVRVKLEGVSADDLIRIAPSGHKKEGNTLTWVFENFKPSRDIEIAFKPPR